jgi:hypothetical protein
MAASLVILSLLIIGLSLYGVLMPEKLIQLAGGMMQAKAGLRIAITVRLLLGMLLWLSASVSRTPGLFKVFAVLMLLTAVMLPVIGQTRLNQLITHLASRPVWTVRLLCLIGVALGGFFLWSVSS